MNGFMKKFAVAALAAVTVVGLASCKKKKVNYGQLEIPTDASQFKAYALAEVNDLYALCGSADDYADGVYAKIYEKYKFYFDSIVAAEKDADVYKLAKEAEAGIASVIPTANGVYNFTSKSNAERTNILGKLEQFAVRKGLTGISLFENGGYVMYQSRVTLGTENYIPGYGFGVLAEGNITADLASESKIEWKRYYHIVNTADPGTVNYLNDKGSEVSDFYGYISASYFTKFMNETKDGYDWVPELAKELPTPLNADEETGMATKWRFPIRVGDELKYSTNSTVASRQAYNNRKVAIEDYITPYKLLLTQKNAYYRGSEMASSTSGAIKGVKEYYNGSQDGFDAELWNNVGLKAYMQGDEAYFEVEFVDAMTPFYAMYYISSSLYMPVPQSFLDLVTVENYLGYSSDKSTTPVDNSLSLGAYVLETWETDKQVAYKKNPNYVYADSKYAIPGVKITIFPAASNDSTATIKEFIAGNVDSCGIPQDYLQEYKNDPRTRKTTGDSNFKLNVNACTPETWEYLFGENGVVNQNAKEDYWAVEPALGNAYFRKALSLSINRVEFADKRGSIASVDYLSSNYMSDPENGMSYSNTQAHKDAVAGLLEDTDGYGFSIQEARNYYKMALQQLEMDGLYTPGTAANPTEIEIEIAWMYPQHETNYHNDIKKYIEDAFNDESVTGGKYHLTVKFWVGSSWSDVYYEKMMTGCFDLGFGSISGNALNPLDFVTVLSSDQNLSGGFTLNWGVDTNSIDAGLLIYNGVRWTYDALVTAGNTTAIVNDGALTKVYNGVEAKVEKNADGTFKVTLTVDLKSGDGFSGEVADIVYFGYLGTTYDEHSVFDKATKSTAADGKVVYTLVLTADEAAKYNPAKNIGFDIYYNQTINDKTDEGVFGSTGYVSFE